MGDLVLMGSFAYIAVVLSFALDRLGRFLDEGGSSPGGGAEGEQDAPLEKTEPDDSGVLRRPEGCIPPRSKVR